MNEVTYDTELCHDFCRQNKESVQKSKKVGCFACYKVYDATEIGSYANQSAICPNCDYDTVLPDSEVPVATDKQFLLKMNREWFSSGRKRPTGRTLLSGKEKPLPDWTEMEFGVNR